MTALEPRVSEYGRYNVTQTCAALGIHRNTLKRYTNERKIKASISRLNGRLIYSGAEIKRVWRARV